MRAHRHHALVLTHHLLHLVRPHRVLPGLHHLLMVRPHRMMVGHRLGNRDARCGYDKHRTDSNDLTGYEKKHWENLIGVDPGHLCGNRRRLRVNRDPTVFRSGPV